MTVERGEHLHDPITGQHVRFLRTGRDTAGAVLEAEVRLDPGGCVPHHAHLRQDERVRVVEGSLVVRVGNKEQVLGIGESVDVPRRRIHVVRNLGEGEARFVMEVRPARRMELAMRAMFGVLRPLARFARAVRLG